MVGSLIRFYEKAILSDGRRKKKGTIGFPVLVKTMVSKSSEELIQEMIRVEFPNSEHLDLWRQREQDRILEMLYQKEHLFDEERRRNPAEFKSLQRFHKWYAENVLERRQWMDDKREECKRDWKPFRGNPF
jgi:hypothetical protein